jgi:neutral trehalase
VNGLEGELRKKVLKNINAAAESGWDFSSRWFGESN